MKSFISPFFTLLSITCCITIGAQQFAQIPSFELSDSWEVYESVNREAYTKKRATLSALESAAGVDKLTSPPHGKGVPDSSKLKASWFESEEGKLAIDYVLSFQGPNGGWSKNIDFLKSERTDAMNFATSNKWISTFDNKSTVPQIRLIAKSYRYSGEYEEAESVLRGLNYIFRSQYPNGGWPQIYPLAGGYHDCVTYNDDAMVSILKLLIDIEQSHPDFIWLPSAFRERASAALAKGIAYTLDSQVSVNGELKGWAQQYDPHTTEPAPARAFEMRSLSSSETSSIIDFLIRIENPTPAVVEAVKGASSWLDRTGIEGYDFTKGEDGNRQLIPNPKAKTIWSRFYEIETDKPIFGDRDGSVHDAVIEISIERRNGYAWYTRDPSSTLNRVRKWQKKRAEK